MTLAAKIGDVLELSAAKPLVIHQSKRILGLDELRGISILWVMWCHGTALWSWMPSVFSGYGFHGVVLFFIISGYLITKILIDQQGQPKYFSSFYISRIFRIWPLMLLALVVSALLFPDKIGAGVYNLLMVNNYAYAKGVEPMVRTDVMWSLAIEEQFYLIWPAVAFLLGGGRAFAVCAAVIVFVGLGFDADLIPRGAGIIFKTTHGNMQYIAMGALIAFGRNGIKLLLAAWLAFFVFWLGAKGVVNGIEEFRWIWWGVSFVLALLVAYTVEKGPLVTSFPLAWVGKLCFGIYLIHFFISWSVLEIFGKGIVLPGVLYFVVSLVLSYLSFRYFEKPILDMRQSIIASEKKVALVFTLMGLMILVCVISLITVVKH
ncbi:hypothetical protein V466_26065 [Pseudomonas mandelii PD30]|uniref:Acyltransferase 3 domain-containing protein n=1 Tax=Pseudomonas mandelii PD30 TaxID=1419583 RepID=A0A059KVI0_9PSED|nr:acyltransferase [Pseudomonas mandelii]KDD66083.1 hypothetical protein V466_26065 [Pseudomonas mandelii PD30]